MSGLLVVTAVAAEHAAIADACPGLAVLVAGVGPAAAAAVTSAELAREPVELVLCAGIGGGFVPLEAGDIAVASASVFADLGAQSADRFVPLSELGYGDERYPVDPRSSPSSSPTAPGGHMGTVLTVATVTGTAARAERATRPVPRRGRRGHGGRRGGRRRRGARRRVRRDPGNQQCGRTTSARGRGGWPRPCTRLAGRSLRSRVAWREARRTRPAPTTRSSSTPGRPGCSPDAPAVEVTFADIDVTNTAAEQGRSTSPRSPTPRCPGCSAATRCCRAAARWAAAAARCC